MLTSIQNPLSAIAKRPQAIHSIRHYGGTWKKTRRLQNPHLVKEMPTLEFVKNGTFKKTELVYVCGFGSTGSLGLPRFYRPDKKSPNDLSHKDAITSTFRRLQSISPKDKLSDIACGFGFTVITGEFEGTSHTAVGFGLNTHSQIGYHAREPGYPLEIVATPSPIFLPSMSPMAKVACGRSHTIYLSKDGRVFSTGNNSLGQCGRPIIEKEQYFGSKMVHRIEQLPSNISQLECGQDHSMFITEDGKIYACGWGADGQTGLGHYDNQWQPAQIQGAIKGVKIIKVSCFADTVLALDAEGNVFGWGNTEYAQFRHLTNLESEQFNEPKHLNLEKIPGKIIDIAAGATICAVLNDHGQVFVWGFGILGKGPNVDQSSQPILIPESLFGMNLYNQDVKVAKIYAGMSNFAAINSQGDLYTWGKNRGSSLGLMHGQNQFFPMQVGMNLAFVKQVALGVDHTCAIVQKSC